MRRCGSIIDIKHNFESAVSLLLFSPDRREQFALNVHSIKAFEQQISENKMEKAKNRNDPV